MTERDYQIPALISRQALVTVMARDPKHAMEELRLNHVDRIDYTQDEKDAEIKPVGPATATEDWRNPT